MRPTWRCLNNLGISPEDTWQEGPLLVEKGTEGWPWSSCRFRGGAQESLNLHNYFLFTELHSQLGLISWRCFSQWQVYCQQDQIHPPGPLIGRPIKSQRTPQMSNFGDLKEEAGKNMFSPSPTPPWLLIMKASLNKLYWKQMINSSCVY